MNDFYFLPLRNSRAEGEEKKINHKTDLAHYVK